MLFAFPLLQGLNTRQHELMLLVQGFLRSGRPDAPALVDDDIALAAVALAGTYETASRGIIYDHKASLPSAERLAGELKTLIEDARTKGLKLGDADVAAVLRRIEGAARDARTTLPGQDTAYLGFLRRILRDPASAGEVSPTPADQGSRSAGTPRVIVP